MVLDVVDRGAAPEPAAALKAALRREIRDRRAACHGGPAQPRGDAGPAGEVASASACGCAPGLLRTAIAAGLLSPAGRAGEIGPIRLAAYLAMPGEPDVAAIVAAVHAGGGTVLLPVPHPGRVLGWAPEGAQRRSPLLPVAIPDTAEVGRGAAPLAAIDLLLVPALAVTSDGTRLGNGGGFYDTLLAELTGRIEVLAVVHDDEVLAAGTIPREVHDVPVAGALTPTRLLRWRRP